jgi:hypothetical protein
VRSPQQAPQPLCRALLNAADSCGFVCCGCSFNSESMFVKHPSSLDLQSCFINMAALCGCFQFYRFLCWYVGPIWQHHDLTLDRYAILLNSWGPLFLLSSCIHDKHKTGLFFMIYFMFFSNGHQTGKHRVRMSNRSEGM